MPEDYPNFPSAAQVLRYLNNYADHFDLRKHIIFETEVTKVQPISDGSQWEVLLSNRKKPLIYKGVIICIGHDWDPNIPTYPGKSTLEQMHSRYVSNNWNKKRKTKQLSFLF